MSAALTRVPAVRRIALERGRAASQESQRKARDRLDEPAGKEQHDRDEQDPEDQEMEVHPAERQISRRKTNRAAPSTGP